MYAGKAISTTLRTFPFVFLRFLVYTLFFCISLFYLGAVFLIGRALVSVHPYAEVGAWILGVIIFYPIYRLMREYLLYIVKAAHVAVIAELVAKGALPHGVSQIQWGRRQVQSRFAGASALFLVDRLVEGIIRTINGIMLQVGNLFASVPGVGVIVKVANLILRFSLTYVDESVLARNFLSPQESVWQSAKTGVVLYAQAWKSILRTAVVLGLAAMIAYPILFIVFLVPALSLGAAYPALKVAFIITAAVCTVITKISFFDPWTLTAMIITYLKTTQEMAPDSEWEARIEKVSSKFRKLKTKALEPIST